MFSEYATDYFDYFCDIYEQKEIEKKKDKSGGKKRIFSVLCKIYGNNISFKNILKYN
jgi:hypothetical protein